MALKLMYITNRPDVAVIAEHEGVDRIFVDMEQIGKSQRQGGMDTVQSHHTLEDVSAIRHAVTKAQVMVRCNPIHEATAEHSDSREEIEQIIARGADVIMLPYFKTVEEVKTFIEIVNGRAVTLLLVETPEAVEYIDEILELEGIDEIFVGLNDLSLGYGRKFMFELLADGTVEKLCEKFRNKGIPYGFGGIASLGKGMLPSEYVIMEHYRLGSTCVILSRSFCNTSRESNIKGVENIFRKGLRDIRAYEKTCAQSPERYESNRLAVVKIVNQIIGQEPL